MRGLVMSTKLDEASSSKCAGKRKWALCSPSHVVMDRRISESAVYMLPKPGIDKLSNVKRIHVCLFLLALFVQFVSTSPHFFSVISMRWRSMSKPSNFDLIREAILALKDRTGSSPAAIRAYLTKNSPSFQDDHHFKAALRSGEKTGKLIKVRMNNMFHGILTF